MPEFTRTYDVADCVGKTVSDYIRGDDDIGLRFADKTYFYAKVARGGTAELYFNADLGDDEQLDLGLIDQAEWDRRIEAWKEYAKANSEDRAYEEYLKLKARFEPKTEAAS